MIRQVTPTLYVGGSPKAKECKSAGIDRLVTLSKKLPSNDVLDLLVDRWEYLPLRDGKVLQEAWYWYAALRIRNYLMRGDTVLVHCLAGRNRSCLVAALVLVYEEKLTGLEAMSRILEVRPNAFHNEAQRAWLGEVVSPP